MAANVATLLINTNKGWEFHLGGSEWTISRRCTIEDVNKFISTKSFVTLKVKITREGK